MDDDNISIGSDFSLGSSIDVLSKETDAAADAQRRNSKGKGRQETYSLQVDGRPEGRTDRRTDRRTD